LRDILLNINEFELEWIYIKTLGYGEKEKTLLYLRIKKGD